MRAVRSFPFQTTPLTATMDPASEETCRSLLTEYLIHCCFKNTAKAFINETKKLDACSNGILYRKLCHDNGIDKKNRTHPNGTLQQIHSLVLRPVTRMFPFAFVGRGTSGQWLIITRHDRNFLLKQTLLAHR